MTQILGTLSLSKGCLFVIFDKENQEIIQKYVDSINNTLLPKNSHKNMIHRDNNLYHLTVISPDEMEKYIINDIPENISKNPMRIYILGFGTNCGCYYLVCGSKDVDDFRKNKNLSVKDLHITVGFDDNDKHDINKNIKTIVKFDDNVIDGITKSLSMYQKKNLIFTETVYNKFCDDKHVIYLYAKCLAENKQFDEALTISYRLTSEFTDSESMVRGYFILIKVYSHLGIKNELTNCVTDIMQKIRSMTNIENTPETNSLIKAINMYILNSGQITKDKILLYYNSENKKIYEVSIWNFSKIDDNTYGTSTPKKEHLLLFKQLGINKIINLIGEHTDMPEVTQPDALKYNITIHHFPIIDRCATSLDTMNAIIAIMETNGASVIHCKAGIGRTNMVLACYLIKKLSISPQNAISMLENNRSVRLASEQILLIKKYYGCVNRKFSSSHKTMPSCMIMLMGLPGSGKTTLSSEFLKYYPENIIHVNQDDFGKKNALSTFMDNIKGNNVIILDRCNLTIQDRKYWMDMYTNSSNNKIIGIYYDLGEDICIDRVKNRENHPTLSGEGGAKIIHDLVKNIDIPNIKEGFSELLIIKDDNDLEKIKTKFGLNNDVVDTIMKFPRTKHIYNLGGASRDDLIYDKEELNNFLKIELLVEEKVDGANMGLFFDNGKIKAQNRSHLVDSHYHEQFKLLDKWILNHEEELMNIFKKGNFIIFGEWLYMKHSINYINLPDWFLIYDIYDRLNEKFLKREDVEKMIKNTTLNMVPIIYQGFANLDKLKELVHTESKYYHGPVEGIYVRAYDKDSVKYRGKIVRKDFICGDTHWTKGQHIINKINK